MKFLPQSLDGSDLMLLRTYYDSGTKDFKTPDDVLDIVYKDIISGNIYIESIKNPKIEIYVVKPEFRDFDYYKNFIEIEKCNRYLVHYKTRYSEIADIMGITPKEVKYSKFVYQIDLDIEHYYMMQWVAEYSKDNQDKPLSIAFSDIESDIIALEKNFSKPGEVPTNAISYLDTNTMTMYTMVCIQDNVPHVSKSNVKYELYEKLRNDFKDQTNYFIDHIEDFVKECHDDFDASYGHIDYKIMVFEDEMALYNAYWKMVHHCQNDYCEFWNAPYDIGNLIERPRVLGYDPNDIIPDPDFRRSRDLKGCCPDIRITWHEDKNYEVHKRRHIFNTYTKTIFTDDMVNYAGIRSGKGKLESVKLNAIARKELEDEKLDYSEYGNIKYFPYLDWWKFVKYNIKDVLLQFGIDKKVHDTDYVYNLMTSTALKPSEIFTSTQLVSNDLRLFALIEFNMVMSSNANKLFRVKKTEEQIKQEKLNKFAGAFVMNTEHCSPTGFKLLGILNKYIHAHIIDFDVGAELREAQGKPN